MATEIKLNQALTYQQECWLEDHAGPILYYLNDKYGGREWSVVKVYEREHHRFINYLKFADEHVAMLYLLRWS